MWNHRLSLVLPLAVIALSGCALQRGSTKVTYARAAPPPALATVTKAGAYGLYIDQTNELAYEVNLAPDDKYGFLRRADDSIVAVARDKEIALDGRLTRAWYWQLETER